MSGFGAKRETPQRLKKDSKKTYLRPRYNKLRISRKTKRDSVETQAYLDEFIRCLGDF